MVPVFEDGTGTQQCVQVSGLIVRNAAEQDMMMRTFNYRDGVDLYIAQTLDGFEHPGFAFAKGVRCPQTLSRYGDSPQPRDDFRRCVHGSG